MGDLFTTEPPNLSPGEATTWDIMFNKIAAFYNQQSNAASSEASRQNLRIYNPVTTTEVANSPEYNAEETAFMNQMKEIGTTGPAGYKLLQSSYGDTNANYMVNRYNELLNRPGGVHTEIVGGDSRAMTEDEIKQNLTDAEYQDYLANKDYQSLRAEGLRYMKGEGEGLRVDDAFYEQKRKAFQTMKDELATRGITVTGNDLDSATADSTAGVQALEQAKSQFRQAEYGIRSNQIGQNQQLLAANAAYQAGNYQGVNTAMQNAVQNTGGLFGMYNTGLNYLGDYTAGQYGAANQNTQNQIGMLNNLIKLGMMGGMQGLSMAGLPALGAGAMI